MKEYQPKQKRAQAKSDQSGQLTLPAQLPIEELMAGTRANIESFAAELGLTIIRRVMEAEVQKKVGPWGRQSAYRHGQQGGYVIFAGRKVKVPRPRLRSREGKELGLSSYAAFQQKGKMQAAVARQLIRQCSSRDYEGALDGCLKGYGIKRSSVSRHWKAATTKEMQQLMERAVPRDLLVLMIDSKFFGGDCVVAAIGIDGQGRKHVLGLWHGPTENATVVKGLLEDLVSRGLSTEQKLLVVIDGAKALRKAVQMVLGQQAVVQRCRVHKLRNVVEQLPQQKQAQARWRIQGAWAQKNAQKAEQELRKTARWLQDSWPMAANSLLEGLEETLAVQRLGLPPLLCRILSSTNIIENCFEKIAHRARHVKRWNGARMILRWSASALLWAEKNFKRIRGCEQLEHLEKSLRSLETITTLEAA